MKIWRVVSLLVLSLSDAVMARNRRFRDYNIAIGTEDPNNDRKDWSVYVSSNIRVSKNVEFLDIDSDFLLGNPAVSANATKTAETTKNRSKAQYCRSLINTCIQ